MQPLGLIIQTAFGQIANGYDFDDAHIDALVPAQPIGPNLNNRSEYRVNTVQQLAHRRPRHLYIDQDDRPAGFQGKSNNAGPPRRVPGIAPERPRPA
jgi:hypothetical protein